MRKKTPVIVFLAAATAVVAFFVFQNTRTSPRNASLRAAPSALPSRNETDNVMPDDPQTGEGSTNRTVPGNEPVTPDLQERYAGVSDNPDYPQLQSRLEAMRERHPGKSFDPEKVVETMARTEAWVRVDTPSDDLPLTPAEKSDGREFIRFNPLRIETLMPGDTLEIPIWQLGARFKMRVDYAETHANGSVTWHGHLENSNEPHRVTITVGDGLSLGGIDTPGGHYVLQANGESGWIASSETLFKRNETETDMVAPPVGEPEGSP